MTVIHQNQVIMKKSLILLLIGLGLLIMFIGLLSFNRTAGQVRTTKHNELQAIAQFKTGQITNWIRERKSDAISLSRSPLFSEAVNGWLNQPENERLRRQIAGRLTIFMNQYGYDNIVLTTPRGELLLSLKSDEQYLAPATVSQILAASQNQTVVFTDFYYCDTHQRIHLDFIANILNPAGEPVAALILRTFPEDFLYPLIGSWPLPSKTAETVLVRRTAGSDSLVILNNLRQQPDAALRLRLPLTSHNNPAVRAVLGETGIFMGKDYRGVPVLAHLGVVPGTDWFMVSKVDRKEIYTEFYRNARHFLMIIGSLLIAISIGVALIYNRRQRNLYSALYADEKERHAMEEQFRATLYSIGDAVIVTDREGAVKYLNPVAENLTGWQEKEAKGRAAREIFKIIDEESRREVKDPVREVIREGTVKGLANHTLLINRDGKEIPIADSGAPITTEDGEIRGVVLVFRDQSAERAAQRALQASEAKFRTLIDQAAEMVFYHDLEGHIIEANQAVIKSLGYSKEELQTMNIMDIDPSAREREDMSHRWKVIKPGDPAITFEAVHRKKDGSIYPVEVTISKVVLPEGEFILGLARDIRERKQAEEKLKVSEMRFRLLAEVAPVGIVIADKDDNVVFVSKKFTEIFGYTIDDIPTIEDWYRRAYPNEPVRDRIRTIWSAAVEEARRTQAEIEPVEYAVVCKDDGIRQIEFRMAATTDLQFVLFTDITERKRIQEALELAVKSAQVGLWEQDLRTGKIIRNEEWAKMLGYDLSEVAANIDFFFDAIHPDDLPRVKETIAAHESGQTDFLQVEQRMRTKNGAWKWILNMGRVVERDINGKPVRAAGVHLDITEHKQTEEQIRESEERYRLLMDNSLDAVLLTIPDGRILSANRAACEMFQMSEAELCAAGRNRIVNLQDPRLPALLEKRSRDGSAKGELTYIRKDGSRFEAEVSSSIFYNSKGEPRTSMIIRDISDRKQAEEEIRIDEERLESLLRINQHPAESIQELLDFALNEAIDLTGSKIGYIYFYDEERKEFTLNTWSRDVMKECSVAHPQRVYQLEKTGIWGEAVRQRRPIMVNDFAAKNPLKKGTPKGHVQLHKFLTIPVFSDSKIVAVVGVANKETDYNDSDIRQLNLMMDAVWKIVQRKQAEDALKTNFSLLKLAGETAKFGGWSIDLTENRIVWSDEVAAIHEMPAGHSPTISEVFRYYVPEWQAKILKAFNRCVEEGIAYDEEVEIITAKGKRLWVRTTGEALIDDSGKIVKIQGSFQDITERKQMEANLKASEEQLRQTQKMEALGQLASGIAHDFNNILSIILGHASLLKMSQRTPEKVQHSIATIEKAGQRGADLIKQLLTLARKNEPETKPLNLGDIIADTVKLPQETFPKTITFQTDIESDLPLVMADASQIHQVLMNLSVNARDAMPKGGTLSFNASREAGQELRQRHPNAIAREYVKLCISDSGVGMDKATVERVFEPFYTTKEQGRGTGLGLATVHGIIRNHNGFVEVESEPAAGTTFRIYLPVPVTQETLDATTAENGAATPTSTSGSETILLIEDEESIIEMLTTIFRTQGYQVIVAMDGHTGVEKYKQSQNDIDLVISDMGLPRLTGEEVFYRIRRINPEARVIIASGFVDPDRKSELYKAGLTRFVQKPYFPMDILKVVREILDESPEASKENS